MQASFLQHCPGMRQWTAMGFLTAFWLGAPALAQTGHLGSEKRNALKESAVRIQTISGGERGSGSGFVVHKDGDQVYIATNQHVISAGEQGEKAQEDSRTRWRVRFAGEDLKAESLRAELLAADQEHDLAILRVQRADAPAVFEMLSQEKLEETMPITIFGYPLGDQYVTINNAQVSGFLHDSVGGMRRVKFYGKVDPGSSGGPVVDRNGAVIGVMVEGDKRSEGIGYCIPAHELREMMRGRLGNFTIRQSGGPEEYDISFSAEVFDPLGKLEKVSLKYILADDVTSDELENAVAGNGTEWNPLSKNMKTASLALRDGKASMTVRMKGEAGDKAYFQLRYERDGEPSTVSRPIRIRLGGKPILPGRYRGDRDEPDEGEGEKPNERDRYPLPNADEQSILGPRVAVNGYRVNEWTLDAASLVPNLNWDEHSLYIYAVTREGVLKKIDPFRNQVDLELNLKLSVKWTDLSGEGVMLLTNDDQLWVVDERNFRVRGVIEKIPGALHVASSRRSFYAFCVTGEGEVIEVYDLVDGVKTQTYKAGDFALPAGSADGASPVRRFDHLTMTPDGRYLFCESDGALHRFVVQDDELTYDQAGGRIGRTPKRIEVSEDGVYVSLIDAEGNRQQGGVPIKPFGIYVYQADDLARPDMAVDGGQPTPYVVREDSSRSVFGTVKNAPLVRFDLEGTKVREFPELEGEFASQILVYPKRPGFLVVLTDAKTYVLKQL